MVVVEVLAARKLEKPSGEKRREISQLDAQARWIGKVLWKGEDLR